jgi:hypothetical protein
MATAATINKNIDTIAIAKGRTVGGTLTSASTSRTGASSTVVFNAPTEGAWCEKITIISKGNNAAAIVRLFHNDGSNKRLFDEIELPTTTASETVAQFPVVRSIRRLLISTETIEACLSVAATDGWSFVTDGGEYTD